ncbi:MAG: RraA family protein [Methanobacterium sp.]|jgi:3-hexulose-6-phosphate synthase
MAKKMKISPTGILERFSYPHDDFELWNNKLSTTQVSDALKDMVNHPWVITDVKPLKDEFKIMGKAVTISTSSNDWGTALKAIDIAEKGDVLIINSNDDYNAVWGELTSKTAQKKGLTGTIIYGAVRDMNAIKNLNYPVFTRSIIPNAGEPLGEGTINVPLNCGGVNINPQDVIIGDDCGVIVVPAEIFPKVMKKTLQIKNTEREIIQKIEDGWPLSKIIGL